MLPFSKESWDLEVQKIMQAVMHEISQAPLTGRAASSLFVRNEGVSGVPLACLVLDFDRNKYMTCFPFKDLNDWPRMHR